MKTILIQSSRADTIDKAIKICEDNLPFMNCFGKAERQLVVFTLMDNLDYCKIIIHKEERGHLSWIDLQHDIIGLSKNDEHFLPRLSMPF